jgi:alpha-amylase
MKTICLYFQVHQPFRFRRYRFFDIGNDHYYYDDYSNESILNNVANRCYLPANKIILDLIKEYGSRFKVTFSISGIALDQFELYAPEVIESFQKLAKTGFVEFLAETYSHSLSSLSDPDEFEKQVKDHSARIKSLFGKTPTVFRNTELIYSDEIGSQVANLGFKAMLTEGAKHVLGWKSPNYVYCNAINPRLKVLLRNYKLSDDIAFRFSNKTWNQYPLTAEKYVAWLNAIDKKEQTVNVFMDYETFGEHQDSSTGIFEFLKALPGAVLSRSPFQFATASEVADGHQPVAAITAAHPISWADEERDITAWLGNELQQAAFRKLYSLAPQVYATDDAPIHLDWKNLQTGDHLYYMCTKVLSDGEVHKYFNPYDSPYDAFINYMNILSDFEYRLKGILKKEDSAQEEVSRLREILAEKDKLISKYESSFFSNKFSKTQVQTLKSIETMKNDVKTPEATPVAESAVTAPKKPVKKAAKKPAAKKAVKKAAPKKAAKKAAPKKAVKKAAPKKKAAKKVVKKAAPKKAAKKAAPKKAAKKVVKKAAPKKKAVKKVVKKAAPKKAAKKVVKKAAPKKAAPKKAVKKAAPKKAAKKPAAKKAAKK